MPRPQKRDLRKRFASLYRFIETDLTQENYLDLTWAAARFMQRWRTAYVAPAPRDRPLHKRAFIPHKAGAARYRAVQPDLDLESARALQTRFRDELDRIKQGDSSPAHTTVSRLIEQRFDRLKRILTNPPQYVQEMMIGSVPAWSPGERVYVEVAERTCIATGCDRIFRVPKGSNQRTCGDRACAIDAGNIRRKQRRTTP